MLIRIFLISICLSIDALGIGTSYELREIKIKLFSKCLIGLMSVLVMYASLFIGDVCHTFFPEEILRILGASILFLIGITFIKDSLYPKETERYDFNKSNTIEWTEAVVLGLALSADSFSAGFALSALEVSNKAIPLLVGMMQIGFLGLGSMIAKHCCAQKGLDSRICGFFSGVLLIVIALLNAVAG